MTAAPDTAAEELPPEILPLVLWTPPAEGAAPGARPITVDNMLLKWLRPHQREGVQFCFEVRLCACRCGVVFFDREEARGGGEVIDTRAVVRTAAD